jgi:DNA-binding transcriptional regulator YiaG
MPRMKQKRKQVRLDSPADLRRFREELGVSRDAFARFLGVSSVSVVRWESEGLKSPKPHGLELVVLRILAKARDAHPQIDFTSFVRDGPSRHDEALADLCTLAFGSTFRTETTKR